MPPSHPYPTAIAIFAITLTLMLTRPRGINEAWAALGGGLAMMAAGIVTWRQAVAIVERGGDVLAFLLALMLLSALLDASGFFDWSAARCVVAAKGSTRALYRNVFLAGAAITALLSLDTTAIILTPIVLTTVRRLKLSAKPFLFACAFVANTGSLLLPVSNLTNLLFQSRLHFGFSHFAATMLLPQLFALAANYAVFHVLFVRRFPARFAEPLPNDAGDVPKDTLFFRAACAVVIVILPGYFVSSLLGMPPFIAAFAAAGILGGVGIWRKRVDIRTINRDMSWPLFGLVAGMFVVVQGLENVGVGSVLVTLVTAHTHSLLGAIAVAACGTAIGSNIVNNIPMALVSLSALSQSHAAPSAIYAALLGCNIGPNLTIAGSLATMLVLSSARQRGEDIRGWDFLKIGVIATPLILAAACLGLWIAFAA